MECIGIQTTGLVLLFKGMDCEDGDDSIYPTAQNSVMVSSTIAETC